MEKIYKPLFLLFLCINIQAATFGQAKKFVVFLHNKAGGNPYILSNPGEYLSQRSIQRRQTQNLTLDSTDLPVTPAYLTAIRNLGAKVLYPMKWINAAIVECVPETLSAINQLPFVLSSSPLNSKMPKSVVERNRSQGTQTLDYGPSANQNIQLGIDSMHAWGFHGEGKLIAVMDGGFQNVNQHTAFQHLFANQRITGTRDIVAADGDVYQDHWHGAAVLGNIAAYAPGQVIGGAYNANYFLIRSEDVDSENEIECAYWVVGLELADSVGADLVNSSLGYTTFDVSSLSYTYNSLNGITSIASRSAKLAGGKGMLVLTSAGNEGNNSSWGGWISVPADAENILSVGSVSGAGTYSSFSGRGPTADGRTKPDIVAQGESVVFPNVFASSGITTNSGTSFSCPLICGMAAGIWQAHPEKSALEILNLLKNSGSNRDNPNNQIGWGIPTFVKAHILAGARPVLSFPFDVRVFPNPARERVLTLDLLESNSVGPAVCAVFDARGSKVFESDLTFDLVHQKQNVVLPGLPAGLYQLQIEMGGKSFQRKIILH